MKRFFSQTYIVLTAVILSLAGCDDHPIAGFECPEIETEEIIVGQNFITYFQLTFPEIDREVEEFGFVVVRENDTLPDIDHFDAIYKISASPIHSPYRVTVARLTDIPHKSYSFYYRGYVRFKDVAEPCYGNTRYFYLQV